MARFDVFADRYDAFCLTPLGAFVDAVERRLILELLAPFAGERIVDLGCGTGAYTVSLAALGCDVTGVDESAAMLARARAKPVSRGRVTYLKVDLARLPWSGASFDAGLLQVTLEFVADPVAVMQEALRVIKPGGRLKVVPIVKTLSKASECETGSLLM